MKTYLFLLTFLVFYFYSCKPDTDTVINEIIVRDTVYVDAANEELGGMKIQFIYANEFDIYTNDLIEGTEIQIPNVDNINISEMNDKGEIFIDGLVSGRTYGIDVFHKGAKYLKLESSNVGSNTYLSYGNMVKIVDVSQSDIRSFGARVNTVSGILSGINFNGTVRGLADDNSNTSRGVVVFLSKLKDVNNLNHQYLEAIATDNKDANGNYVVNFEVLDAVLKIVMDISEGDTLYYTAQGVSGFKDRNNGDVASQSYYGIGTYTNANPKRISGSIVYN